MTNALADWTKTTSCVCYCFVKFAFKQFLKKGYDFQRQMMGTQTLILPSDKTVRRRINIHNDCVKNSTYLVLNNQQCTKSEFVKVERPIKKEGSWRRHSGRSTMLRRFHRNIDRPPDQFGHCGFIKKHKKKHAGEQRRRTIGNREECRDYW